MKFVPDFKYLGAIIPSSGQTAEDVKRHTDAARTALLQLRNTLWRRNEISLKPKLRVFRATVQSILLYGCETQPLTAEGTRKRGFRSLF